MITEGAVVHAVRARQSGRVRVAFGPDGWELRPSPVTKDDLTVWWWWTFGLSLLLGGLGTIPEGLFGAPRWVTFAFAAPSIAILVGSLIGVIIYGVVEAVAIVLGVFGLFTRRGRKALFSRRDLKPEEPPLMVLPAHAVTAAQVKHRWFRVVIKVRMADGAEFRYARWGRPRPRTILEKGFRELLGARVFPVT